MADLSGYAGRSVLVTGLTGFKGVWLGEWLRGLGARVSGLALEPDEAMLRGWPGLSRRWPCHTADVRDEAAVNLVVAAGRPEIVFHLAAQPLVRTSYADPAGTFAANVMGTVNVLEAARRTPTVRAVVVVTSDKCYENRDLARGYREGDPLGGHDPYSASKGCAEIVVASYRRSFGLTVATARAGNVVGGGDWAADRLVPDFVRAVAADRPLVLRRPEAVRPWQHVLEAVAGYLQLGERLLCDGEDFAAAWNFGPDAGEALTVRELADLVVRRWGRGQVVEERERTGPHEARLLTLDSSKAVRELGWRPLLSSADRVGWAVDWYSAWLRDPVAVWGVTRSQIERYQRLMRTTSARPAVSGAAAPEMRTAA